MRRVGLITGVMIAVVPFAGVAEPFTLSTKSRADLLRSQLQVLDDRAAAQYSNSIRLQPPHVMIPGAPQSWSYIDPKSSPYITPARRAAEQHGIPVDLFLRLVEQESGWNPTALSPKGAYGLAQLMPDTARRLGVDPRKPSDNLLGGARYLRMMFDRFGSWRLALAAYNAGPEAVQKYRGIPPYDETQNYVTRILAKR